MNFPKNQKVQKNNFENGAMKGLQQELDFTGLGLSIKFLVFFKDQNHFPPEHRRHLSDLLKIIIICTRNTRSNVPKSILNCFRNTQDMFCCKNKIKTHDSVPNFIDETRKIHDFDRFSLSELGFGMTIWKDPRQQSTKVEKSKIQCQLHKTSKIIEIRPITKTLEHFPLR